MALLMLVTSGLLIALCCVVVVSLALCATSGCPSADARMADSAQGPRQYARW